MYDLIDRVNGFGIEHVGSFHAFDVETLDAVVQGNELAALGERVSGRDGSSHWFVAHEII